MKITRHVQRLEAYTPGEQPRGKNIVKLNTNENPYPPSPKCAEALSAFNWENLRRYPDPSIMELKKAIARLNKVKAENVFIGNGSDEVLSVAARAFVENNEAIASLDPSYSLYKTLAAIRDVPWNGYEKADLNPGETAKKNDALFLWTNPNAPTGTLSSKKQIASFAKKFPGVVIVDEAYADFASENCMELAASKSNRNLIVMRTFSKSYSLAGLRVGYAVGPVDLIEAMDKVKDSYNIDAIAQAVALAAVKDQKWMKRNVAKVIKTRKRFTRELERLGWDVLPSEANFVFAKPPKNNAAEIFESLKKHNIFVRYFSGPKTCQRLRITIGTDAEMDRLLKFL